MNNEFLILFFKMLYVTALFFILSLPGDLCAQDHPPAAQVIPGAWSVQSGPSGLCCGDGCNEKLPEGGVPALEAAGGLMVSRWPGGCSGITPGIDGSALFEPVDHPGFLLKKARLRVRTGGTVNRGRLIISVREAELLQDAADELHNGGLFTAGFFSGSHILSVSIDGRSFVKKKNSALLFYSFSEKGKVRILINPNKGLIKVSATSFTLPIDDYNLSPVCAFIDIGSFRYDIDLQDVDGQLKVTKTALTFTVRNVRKF